MNFCAATNQDIADISSCGCNTPGIAEETKELGVSRIADHARNPLHGVTLEMVVTELNTCTETARSPSTKMSGEHPN